MCNINYCNVCVRVCRDNTVTTLDDNNTNKISLQRSVSEIVESGGGAGAGIRRGGGGSGGNGNVKVMKPG